MSLKLSQQKKQGKQLGMSPIRFVDMLNGKRGPRLITSWEEWFKLVVTIGLKPTNSKARRSSLICKNIFRNESNSLKKFQTAIQTARLILPRY